jgi:signal transduction histidine kinase
MALTAPQQANDGPASEAAALDDQKRSFLRLASHELRTPLNSILGFSEILARELYGPLGAPQYKEYAEIIQGSGRKLLKLVNQVMEIARLEGADPGLQVRAEPIVAIIEDTLTSLREDLGARGLTTMLIADGPTPLALCDPWGLRTVLTALIHNAIAFSPEDGEIRIRVIARDRTIDVQVEDDGEGVDPAELPRLLRPFEQGENALTRRSEGAGLGLPICELTCQAMNGQLQLVCEPGKGLTARVRLGRG